MERNHMKYACILLVINLMGAVQIQGQDAHGLFTEILRDYVHSGKVDYPELCKDDRLEAYIGQLAETNPDTIASKKAKLAFWLNAYNAFTLKVICDHYPVESINDLHFGGLYIGTLLKKTIWDEEFVVVNHQKISLNHIEHGVIRALFKDPRAHFALVCASVSCPPLRSEAYEKDKLDEQLDDQGRVFFGQTNKNRFEIDKKRAYLSKILDWFSDDFGENDQDVLLYIVQFLPDYLAAAIKAEPHNWKIKHTRYDWSLNE